MRADEEERFLNLIDDPTIKWDFVLTSGETVTARVINYLKTSRGTPLTLMVLRETEARFDVIDTLTIIVPENRESFEIPWTSIMTITKHKERK